MAVAVAAAAKAVIWQEPFVSSSAVLPATFCRPPARHALCGCGGGSRRLPAKRLNFTPSRLCAWSGGLTFSLGSCSEFHDHLHQQQHGRRRRRKAPPGEKMEMDLIDGRHWQQQHQQHQQRALSRGVVSAAAGVDAPTTSQRSLAYELVQGALVRWTERRDKSVPETPTAVLIHGILGSRKNWSSFARRLAQGFPSWQFLLVDLRCHGDSSLLQGTKRRPHTVASAARDVLQLVGQLKLTPRVLVGHSFGGKVALSMVDQAAKPLARPVRVWMLDATPGRVRVGGDGEDCPDELIAALQEMPALVPSRRAVIEALTQKGFSSAISRWMTTNLYAVEGSGGGFSWLFDLDGVSDMYHSYEDTNLWPIVEGVPEGVHIDFLRAERSLHRWHHDDVERIRLAERIASREGAGVQMHVLEDAGHWVHTDNPEGLFRILSSSFMRQ